MSLRFPDRRSSAAGFTLVELLLTVGVIGVLMVLLFSVTGTLRRQSENTRCIANLRGIGPMLMAYAADHRGLLPPGHSDIQTDVVIRNENGHVVRPWPARLAAAGYAADENVFLCPSFFPRNLDESRRRPFRNEASETYGMREWTLPSRGSYGVVDYTPHKPLAAIEDPSNFFLIADSYWAPGNWQSQGYQIIAGYRGSRSSFRIHLRHGDKANALFADGHVEAKDREYFENLHLDERQKRYIGGLRGGLYQFTVESNPPTL